MNRTRARNGSGKDSTRARPGRANRMLATIMAGCVLLAACGNATTTTAAPAASTGPASAPSMGPASAASVRPAGPPPELTIPPAPTAATAPTGSIDDQAAALAKAVAPGGQAALAPLLAAYRAAGIPVIGGDGHPLAGFEADQIGPGWWQVWLSAGGNPKFAISLTDATKLLVAMPAAPTLDTGAVAAAAMADLRTMAGDSDAHRRFFARFIADLSTARSGVDALAPATTADDLKLSPVAVEFLVAGMLRSIAIAAVTANPASALRPAPLIASIDPTTPLGPPPLEADAPAGNPCNPTGDLEATSYWTQWIASKLTGGLNLPGMDGAMKSAVELVVKNAELASKVGRAAAILGGAIAALTFLLEMATLSVMIDVTPPLERTKDATSPGKQAVLSATLKYDLNGSSLDGGVGVKNCLLVFLNALGIQATLPANGAVPGAMLKFLGEEGFNQGTIDTGGFVLFTNGASQITQPTGDDGVAKIDIEGRAQKKQIPDSAPEWHRNATVRIFAQPEAENARSLANMFWDSFVAAGAGPVGAVAPIIDILKGDMFDLGDYGFLVVDWLSGWTFEGTSATGSAKGLKCDGLGGEWLIKGDDTGGGVTTSVLFRTTIDDKTLKGTYRYESIGSNSVMTGTVIGAGTASIAPQSDGSVIMTLDSSTATSTGTIAGNKQSIKVPIPGWTYVWKPGGTCAPPPA